MQRVNIKKVNLAYYYGALKPRTITDMVVVHHTGNPTDDDLSAEEINASHQAQGWACIGYHYVIRKDGTIEAGRPHWTVGAHAYKENYHTIGIHVCGNFELAEPTLAEGESLDDFLADRSAFEDFDAEAAAARDYHYVDLYEKAVQHLIG